MKNKRIMVTILFLLLMFVLTACSSSITSSTTNTKTTLESTTSSMIKETTKPSFDVSDYILNADQYILDNLDSVGQEFRNTYHLMAPIGWINDPNGFNEFDGKYHLFYQFHPYSAEWGPMHWGHQTTTDFIKWDLEPTALAPDMRYDENGCFSGTSVVVGDRLYLAYTAVTDNQNQALAYTEDGKTFKKLDELILSGADLPEGYSNADFRDPKIFERDGKYYILCGNKGEGKKESSCLVP